MNYGACLPLFGTIIPKQSSVLLKVVEAIGFKMAWRFCLFLGCAVVQGAVDKYPIGKKTLKVERQTIFST